MFEKTLVILKPDALARNLVGRIITRFEEAGLRVANIKLIAKADEKTLGAHYGEDPEWIKGLGNKTLSFYAEKGLDVKRDQGTDDPLALGKMIRGWLINYISSGPIIPMVIEGNEAISIVRKLLGNTMPPLADPGSIRGAFAGDSSDVANAEKRAVKNLVHASGNAAEAQHEIKLWFG